MVNRKITICGITTLALFMLVGIAAASQDSTILVNAGVGNLTSDPEYSLQAFNYAITLDPQDSVAWFEKGTVLGMLNRPKEAEDALDNAILLSPNDGLYYVQKSLVLLMQGKIGAAGNSVDKGLMLNPDLALGWTDKGLIAQEKGDKVEADYDYQKALSLDPTDPTALKRLETLKSTYKTTA